MKDPDPDAVHKTGRIRALAETIGMWARPSSILIVPVTAAELTVAEWLGQDRVDFDGAPLHVTVMYPFLSTRRISAKDEEAIAELASGINPFTFSLASLGRFRGVTYLAPDPAAPFVRMTELIQRRWPSCVPYGGIYDEIVPHVTVALGDPVADTVSLEQRLPITMQAEELWLMKQTPHGWQTRSRFALGITGPPCHNVSAEVESPA
jgi:2'-5' RNA ligase